MNVVSKQCMELNFVNVCERSEQEIHGVNIVKVLHGQAIFKLLNICECSQTTAHYQSYK